MLIDAVALCGTKDCVDHLVKEIKSRQITPTKGAWAIKALINVRVVSKHMIDQLLHLSEQQIAEQHPALKQSCLLTAGSMMNALCAENEDKLALEIQQENSQRLCPRELKQRYVEVLFGNRNLVLRITASRVTVYTRRNRFTIDLQKRFNTLTRYYSYCNPLL